MTLRIAIPAAALLALVPAARAQALLEYQFNEVRGTTVANVSGSPAFPSHGTLPNADWRTDPGRPIFSGNEVGVGCLSQNPAAGTNVVDTGAPVSFAGSTTVMFWARRDPSSTSSSPFGYFFGDGSFRCFMGSAGVLLGGHGPISSTYVANFSGHLVQGVWNHYAFVIDDTAGNITAYENGVAHASPLSFTPGTYVYNGSAKLAIGANGVGSSSRATTHYDMDDFRIYAVALTAAQVLTALGGESAAASTAGAGCAGPGGVPAIGSAGGAPSLGNAAFAIVAGNLEPGTPQFLNLGLFPSGIGLPFDLSSVLGPSYAGCNAELWPDLLSVGLGGAASATVGVPIPNLPSLTGWHLYGQVIVAGTQGAVSPLLDVNLQN